MGEVKIKISLEELNELLKQLKNSQRDFSASVESAQDKAQAISDSHAMRGLTKGAINAEIENYKIPLLLQYNDIDDALIADFEKAINDFKTATSETSANAVIYESSLTTLEQKIAPIKSEYDLLVAKINHTQSTVGDLVSLTSVSSSGVSEGLEASKRILTKLKQDMRSFNSKKEYGTTKSLLAEQKSVLKTVGKALSGGFDDNSSIKTFNDTEYLYKVLDKSKTFNKQVEKRYGKSKYWKIIQEYGGIKNVNRLGYLIMQMQKINKNIQDDISPYTMTLKKFEDAMGFMKGFYDKIAKKNGKGKLIQALEIEWRKLSKKKVFQNLLHNGFITHSFNGTLTQWSKISYKNKTIFNKFYSKLPDKYFGKFKKVMSKLGNSKVGKGVVNLLENAQHNERLLEAMKKGAKVREKGVAIFEVLDKVTKPEELVKDLGKKYFERLTKAPETKREIAAEIQRLTKSNAHVSSLKKYTLKKSYKFYGKVG